MKNWFSTKCFFILVYIGISLNLSAQGTNCSNPIPINTLPFNYNGTTCGFGDDYSASNPLNNLNASLCTNNQNQYFRDEDIFFSYTPTVDTLFNFSYTFGNTNGRIHILNGCPNDPNAECVYYSGQNQNCPQFVLNANQTYYIIVDSRDINTNCTSFNFTFNFGGGTSLVNDFCFGALPLLGDCTNYFASNCGEPDSWTPNELGYNCVGGNWNGNHNGVWYHFTNDSLQDVSIELFDIECTGSNFNTLQVGVWTNTGTCDLAVEDFMGCLVANGDATLNLFDLPQGEYYMFCDGSAGANCTWQFSSDDITIIDTCNYLVGTMHPDTLIACPNDCVTAIYDGTDDEWDGGMLQYVLHSFNGDTIYTEIARSNQPSFCYIDGITQPGVVYYISAVVGDNVNGNIPLTDSCTVVAAGTPVYWRSPSPITIQPHDSITCNVNNVAIQALPNVNNYGYEWGTTNGNITSPTNTTTITVSSGGDYMLTITDELNCPTVLTTTVDDTRNQFTATITSNPDTVFNCIVNDITLSGTPQGIINAQSFIWQYNGNIISNNQTIQAVNNGTYVVTITDMITGCTDVAQITLTENIAYPILDLDGVNTLNCLVDTIYVQGSSPFDNITFSWWVLDTDGDTTLLSTNQSIDIYKPNTYFLRGYDLNNGCINTVPFTIEIDTLHSNVFAGYDEIYNCAVLPTQLQAFISNDSVPYDVTWHLIGSTSTFTNYDTLNPFVTVGGNYVCHLINTVNFCENTDTVLIDAPNQLFGLIDYTPITCNNPTATFAVQLSGDIAPYNYSVNDTNFGTQSIFPNLAANTYTINVASAGGCTWDTTFTITQPTYPELTIGADHFIQLGDSVQLQAITNITQSAIDTIIWLPQGYFSCLNNCLNQTVYPTESFPVEVILVDTFGCEVRDFLNILVSDEENTIYIPNVFTPNNDGFNDEFQVYGGTNLSSIDEMYIYSRWGSMVFAAKNLAPNSSEGQWNGMLANKLMNPAVFVYYIKVTFTDGESKIFKGDVTLMR